MRRFEERVVLVTGAAAGIGRATCLRLAEEGATLGCVDVQQAGLEETAKEAEARGASALALVCDVSDPAAVERTVAEVVRRFGRLDALCNVAGILTSSHTHEETLERWSRVLAVNLTGTFLMCRAAIPHLLETRGAIVNVASTAALAGHPWMSAYAASKGGVLSFTRSLAVEYAKQGLRVNAVCPGSIETAMSKSFHMPEGADPKLLQRIMPLTRFDAPDHPAAAIAYLASDDARFVTGEALRVDGGMLA